MSKSKARFLAELLSSDGKVIKTKSQASTIVVGDLPTIPNSKLQNSSVTIAGEGLSLGASLTLDTGDVTEHTAYKYYTDARARAAISATGSLSYNSTTGVMSFTMPAQNTSNITEGSNLYYTNARADARIVNAGSANWNTAYGWGNHASAGYSTTDTTYSVQDGELSQNNFTNADHSKLDGIAASANNYSHPSNHAISVITGLQTALDGKVDDSQVLTNVPSGAVFTDTNTTYSVGDGGLSQNNFTNADHSKLDGIATGATNTAAPHYTSAIAVGAGGLTQQNFTTTLKNKLDGIAASANNYVLPFTNNSSNWNTAYGWGDHASAGYTNDQTPAELLTAIKTVDGSGSGLDADLLDGVQLDNIVYGTYKGTFSGVTMNANSVDRTGLYSSSGFTNRPSGTGWTYLDTKRLYQSDNNYHKQFSYDAYNNNMWTRTNNGGTWSSWYAMWNSFNDGSGSGLDADLLDGQQGSYYRAYANLTGTPTIPSLSGYATESYVGTQISNLVDSSPAALNTLNELAAAIGDDASFSTTVTNNIATKMPKAGGTFTGSLIQGYAAGTGEMFKWQNNTSGGHIQLGFQQNDTDGLHHRLYVKAYKGSASASGNVDLIVRGSGGSLTSDVLELHHGQRASWQGNDIFTDAYHPNADTLTTARTINGVSFNGSANITVADSTKLPLAGGTMTGNLTAPTLYLNNTNTRLHEGSGDSLRISTSTGYIDIGSMNSGWIHFQGNKPYYFNQPMHIDNHLYPYSTAGARNIGGTGNIWNHVYAKGYFIDSTEVIDASRNLTNIGTISSGVITATGGNSGNWNTAYGWGNHASASYLTNSSSEVISYVYRISSTDSTTPDSFGYDNRYQTFNYGVSSGITGPLITFGGLGSGYPMQLTGRYSGSGTGIKFRTRNGDTATWNSWYTLWHNGNDGSGSGLDADLLDGQQGSYYAPASHVHSYLPLAGGTITGNLNVNGNTILGNAGGDYVHINDILHLGATDSGDSHFYMGEGGNGNITYGNHYHWDSSYTMSKYSRYSGTDSLIEKHDTRYTHKVQTNRAYERLAHSTGYQIGSYNSVGDNSGKTNPIYVIGDNYRPTDTSVSGMYGIGYAHSNLWGTSNGKPSAWGHYVVEGGQYIHVTTNGGTWSLGEFNRNGNKVWDAGNDGAGSGLDADLLDGQQGSYYAPASHVHSYLPLTGGTLTGTLNVSATTNARDIKISAGYHLQRSDHHSGHLEGSYNNIGGNGTKSNPIYTIGSSYNPGDAALSNMYGIGYTDTSASFINFTGAGSWGMYVAADGDARVWLGGSNGVISSTGQHYVGSNVVWNAGNDGPGSGLDADLLDGQQGSYYYAASNPSGYLIGSGSIAESHRVSGNAFATAASSPGSALEYQQAASQTDTKLAPSTDWYNSIRMGHGNPYSYYSNTMAMKMTGTGSGTLYTQVISNNSAGGWNKYWHTNNDGSGSGLDADLLDGKSHENFGATLATFGTTSGTGGRIRCTAPFNTNSGKMFQVTVSLYTSYQVRNYVVAGYMYSTSNQWYSATAIYSGAGTPDIKVGRDSSGKAYISIARGSYTGVRVHSMTRGYYTSVADTYDPWTITENDATENSLTPTTSTTWHSTNDGSGSGLDADLLDGYNAEETAVNNSIVKRDGTATIKVNGVYLGGTGAANKLDDYEEGTWTPTSSVVTSLGINFAKYTKIGSQVTVLCQFYGRPDKNQNNYDTYRIGGLPFQPNADAVGGVGKCGGQYFYAHNAVARSGTNYIEFYTQGSQNYPSVDNDVYYNQDHYDYGNDGTQANQANDHVDITITYLTDQ